MKKCVNKKEVNQIVTEKLKDIAGVLVVSLIIIVILTGMIKAIIDYEYNRGLVKGGEQSFADAFKQGERVGCDGVRNYIYDKTKNLLDITCFSDDKPNSILKQ